MHLSENGNGVHPDVIQFIHISHFFVNCLGKVPGCAYNILILIFS